MAEWISVKERLPENGTHLEIRVSIATAQLNRLRSQGQNNVVN